MRSFDNEDRPDFFNITTIGERGQVVIPKEARVALSLSAGDKLVVLPSRHGNGILLMKEENIRELAQKMSERADHISEKSKKLQAKLHDVEQTE
jgi:AbrB family looped-hinge helix DNA binding protein